MLQKSPQEDNFDIAIVGAGITGLTAAIQAAERSNKKILLLEGAERAGGRVKSLKLDNGTKTSAGAHWFHGGDDNPFFQWVKGRYKNLHKGMALEEVKDRITVWGNKADPEGSLRKAFNVLEGQYEKFARKHPGRDISLHDLAKKVGDKDARKAAEFMAREWMARDSSHDISCYEYFNDPLGPGGWQLNDGGDPLIDKLVADATSRGVEIRYSQKVMRAERVDGRAHLVLNSGERIMADNALITASPEVLRNRGISLGKRVQKAIDEKIEGIAMGNLAKIIVPLKEEIVQDSDIPDDARVYMIKNYTFIHAFSGGKPHATIFMGGSPSHAIENWNEGELTDMVNKRFSQVEGFENLLSHKAGSVVTTDWHGNELIQGSYSVCAPGYKRPNPFFLGPIHFAGEWTVEDPKESPGQMVGAFYSGRRAAEQLTYIP